MGSFRNILFGGLPAVGGQALGEMLYRHWLSPFAVWGAVILPSFVIYKTLKVEKSLAVYSLVYYVGVLAFGALASMPRFISTLFPLWLPFTSKLSKKRKSAVVVIVASAVSFVVGLDLWINFLNGRFIS
jgi:hypothetical protein